MTVICIKTSKLTMESMIKRFRPNLVISGDESYEEENWSSVTIGGCDFQVRRTTNLLSILSSIYIQCIWELSVSSGII